MGSKIEDVFTMNPIESKHNDPGTRDQTFQSNVIENSNDTSRTWPLSTGPSLERRYIRNEKCNGPGSYSQFITYC